MDLKEIADGLTATFNIDGLAVVDGELALEIDGLPILLGEPEGDAILMTGFIGEAPSEGGEAFSNLMLEATTTLMDKKSAALARRQAHTCSSSASSRITSRSTSSAKS